MKVSHLTKRENEIMEIFWRSNKPLSSNDICLEAPHISKNTVQAVIRKLLSMNFIEIAGLGYNKNALTREFSPCISQAEYFDNFLVRDTSFELAANFIQHATSLEVLNQMEDLIKERKAELESK
ncbi:BlaI/MecI/CopY family transcriptional regulator [Dubosiella newyorkensis]|jgi:BlaI family penicillinase repressor|uniref:Transcriptional regulator n=1 Tax=Dubosiella newyorkensis TaxID=1862672 RepID=A0A1U7NM65_9FIRM|nr:BlaI/MecI/CopY family transcriptional regulator [Dubosiella newyorkensis]MCI9040771.1 BlaI/MecI/CopY family transcriptional regulator [Dubosiella newyorkensis]OLU46219.1 hypothetical protein BO225_06990 [Dubosiella newyorkensis]